MHLLRSEFAGVCGEHLIWSEFLSQDPALELFVIRISQVEEKRAGFLSIIFAGFVQDGELLFEFESTFCGPAALFIKSVSLKDATQRGGISDLVLSCQLIPEDLNKAATERITTLNASVLHLAEDIGADEPWSSKRI